MKKIAQGAEAQLLRDGEYVVKERVKKAYRIKEIDEILRKKRTRTEAKLMREARRAGVLVPHIDEEEPYSIRMSFIGGKKVRDVVNNKNFGTIGKIIGKYIAILHDYGIIHGDLTTSNMIMKNDDIYFIDFGLGFFGSRPEDKATDLHLLKEVIDSTHFEVAEEFWNTVLEAYVKNARDSERVIKTLQKIEKRGRYVKREAK